MKERKAVIVHSGRNIQNVGKLILRFDGKNKLFYYSQDFFPLTNDILDSPQVAALLEDSKKVK